MQDRFLSGRQVGNGRRDEGVALVGAAFRAVQAIDVGEVAAGNVVVEPVRQVLERYGDAGRTVVLEHRQGHDLIHHPSDDDRQMRAKATVVLPVMLGVSEAHVDEDVGVVTDHMRIAIPTAVVALDIHLKIAAVGRRSVPAHAVHGPLA